MMDTANKEDTSESTAPKDTAAPSSSVSSLLGAELKSMKAPDKKYQGIRVLQTPVAGNYFVETKDHGMRGTLGDSCVFRACACHPPHRSILTYKTALPPL